MMGNKDLFSSYKAIDGGNVVFGSNTKSKIVRKVLENVDILVKPSTEDLGLINVAVSLTIMKECFVPMVDIRTCIYMIPHENSDKTGYKELGVEKSGSNPEGELCNTMRMERCAQKQAKLGTKNVGWYENWYGLLPSMMIVVSVFDFQPQDPKSISAALAGLLGRKLPDKIHKFNRNWENDLIVGQHDCRHYTKEGTTLETVPFLMHIALWIILKISHIRDDLFTFIHMNKQRVLHSLVYEPKKTLTTTTLMAEGSSFKIVMVSIDSDEFKDLLQTLLADKDQKLLKAQAEIKELIIFKAGKGVQVDRLSSTMQMDSCKPEKSPLPIIFLLDDMCADVESGSSDFWVMVTALKEFHETVPTFPVKAVDTIGASDSFIGALLTKIVDDQSMLQLKGEKVPESEYTTLSNGLKYYDLKVGKGAKVVKGSRVAVRQHGKSESDSYYLSD
nr:hypothetical protein [Tanacetum cinerariifolium]